MYLNNLEDHKAVLLCRHFSKKRFLMICWTLWSHMPHLFLLQNVCSSMQEVTIFFSFLCYHCIPNYSTGRKDILLIAINCTLCLVISVSDYNLLKSKVEYLVVVRYSRIKIMSLTGSMVSLRMCCLWANATKSSLLCADWSNHKVGILKESP